MIGKKLPVFNRGKILTRDMLHYLAEFAVADSELLYRDYSDGVLCGCELTTTQEQVTVHPGILIFSEKAYYITQEIALHYSKTNEWMILKVRMLDQVLTENFCTEELEIVLEPEALLCSKDIELCRFKLQQGAKLRTIYKNFDDMETEYDTVHYTYAKWAAWNKSSLSPVILRMFYNEAVKQDLSDDKYLQFCMKIAAMKQETLNSQEIALFISSVLSQPYEEMENETLYKNLKVILSMIKGHGGPTKRRTFMDRKMIVD